MRELTAGGDSTGVGSTGLVSARHLNLAPRRGPVERGRRAIRRRGGSGKGRRRGEAEVVVEEDEAAGSDTRHGRIRGTDGPPRVAGAVWHGPSSRLVR